MLRIKQNEFYRKKHLIVLIMFFVCLFILADSSQGKSFPFRVLKVGNPVPDAQFSSYQGEDSKSISSLAGKPILLAFWGGDMAAKKKRAAKALKALQELEPYLTEKGVEVLVVNMQNDPQAVIDEVSEVAGLSIPVYKDASGTVYSSFGLYVLPSLLFVNAEGNISGGIGYSKDIIERLRGEVDIMLGLLSHEELEVQLNPVMEEVSKEVKLSLRHLNMGTVLKNKGMPEAAHREFQAALELNPELHEARVKLGCLYLEEGSLDDAIRELEAGLEGDPKSIEAEICLARVSAEMGELDEAVMDLQALLFRNGRNSDLHYTVGTFLERQGKFAEAAKEYRKAFELLQRKTELHE